MWACEAEAPPHTRAEQDEEGRGGTRTYVPEARELWACVRAFAVRVQANSLFVFFGWLRGRVQPWAACQADPGQPGPPPDSASGRRGPHRVIRRVHRVTGRRAIASHARLVCTAVPGCGLAAFYTHTVGSDPISKANTTVPSWLMPCRKDTEDAY